MKPRFVIPPRPAPLGAPATDLHDSAAKLPADVQTGGDTLAMLFEAGLHAHDAKPPHKS